MSEQATPQTSAGEIRHAPAHSLKAVLRIRDFRLLWIGLGLSSLGDWLGLLALTALANEMAGPSYAAKNFAIAGVLFLRVLPALVMAPIAGWIADRLDRRVTLIWGDYVRGALFLTIPLVGTLWWVCVEKFRSHRAGMRRDPGPGVRRASPAPTVATTRKLHVSSAKTPRLDGESCASQREGGVNAAGQRRFLSFTESVPELSA